MIEILQVVMSENQVLFALVQVRVFVFDLLTFNPISLAVESRIKNVVSIIFVSSSVINIASDNIQKVLPFSATE